MLSIAITAAIGAAPTSVGCIWSACTGQSTSSPKIVTARPHSADAGGALHSRVEECRRWAKSTSAIGPSDVITTVGVEASASKVCHWAVEVRSVVGVRLVDVTVRSCPKGRRGAATGKVEIERKTTNCKKTRAEVFSSTTMRTITT